MFCGSVEVFEAENISTWEGLEPHIFGFMPNAVTIWSIRARHFLFHVFEHWLYRYFLVKLIFEMLTVRSQQHSFSTDSRMFFWKCQRFWRQKMCGPERDSKPNLSDFCRMLYGCMDLDHMHLQIKQYPDAHLGKLSFCQLLYCCMCFFRYSLSIQLWDSSVEIIYYV